MNNATCSSDEVIVDITDRRRDGVVQVLGEWRTSEGQFVFLDLLSTALGGSHQDVVDHVMSAGAGDNNLVNVRDGWVVWCYHDDPRRCSVTAAEWTNAR